MNSAVSVLVSKSTQKIKTREQKGIDRRMRRDIFSGKTSNIARITTTYDSANRFDMYPNERFLVSQIIIQRGRNENRHQNGCDLYIKASLINQYHLSCSLPAGIERGWNSNQFKNSQELSHCTIIHHTPHNGHRSRQIRWSTGSIVTRFFFFSSPTLHPSPYPKIHISRTAAPNNWNKSEREARANENEEEEGKKCKLNKSSSQSKATTMMMTITTIETRWIRAMKRKEKFNLRVFTFVWL